MISLVTSSDFKPNKSHDHSFRLILLGLCGLILNSIQQISFANEFGSKFSNSLSTQIEHTKNSANELILKNKQSITKEQQAAKKIYETAQKVHLLEQHTFRLLLPNTFAPKYTLGKSLKLNISENKHAFINPHSGCANNVDIVPDAAAITPTQTHSKNTQAPHAFSLKLSLNTGIELHSTHSVTHELILQLVNNTYQLDTRQPRVFTLDCVTKPI